jgi:hypothetical protein
MTARSSSLDLPDTRAAINTLLLRTTYTPVLIVACLHVHHVSMHPVVILSNCALPICQQLHIKEEVREDLYMQAGLQILYC